MPLLHAESVFKTYRLGRVSVPVLRGASLAVEPGECVAVLGASGSGKSTLLHLLGGLDRPDRLTPPLRESSDAGSSPHAPAANTISFNDRPLNSFSSIELDRYRRSRVGFVFQFYHLLPELSVLDNTLIAAMIRHGRLGWHRNGAGAAARKRAEQLLARFGLSHRLKHRPVELSGGERQRVAIARALINQPDVLLADEPTGNLDHTTGGSILDALMELRRESKLTMVIVTHDHETAGRADRTVRIADGVVTT